MAKSFDSRASTALLEAADLRVTKPRQVLAHVLLTARDHPDADQVLSRAREYDSTISQATTYRTLSALVEKGVLVTHLFDGNAARFEIADRPHHDHIIDMDSGEIREFVSEEIEKFQSRIAKELGYEIVAHRLELYCRKIV